VLRQHKAALFFALLALQALTALPGIDPFAFLQPSVTITEDDRRKLDRDESIAHAVAGQDRELAVIAVVPVDIDGDRFVAWLRRIEELKKSSYVQAIGRFSDPPQIEDLAGLALDDEDLSDIRACRPQDCALKLSVPEMTRLQTAATEAEEGWRDAVQQAFRDVLLERVRVYLSTGEAAPYENQENPVWPADRFASLVEHSVFLTEHLPRFAEHLRGYPSSAVPDIESFIYWSKERLARKAVISLTHVSILRGQDPLLPDALEAGRQIFATHYVNASLGLTAIVRGEPGGPNYLVYVNRSELDMPGGPFKGILKWFLQRRLKAEAATVLQGLRQRLESGEPPATG
jgi:hypothetical protein